DLIAYFRLLLLLVLAAIRIYIVSTFVLTILIFVQFLGSFSCLFVFWFTFIVTFINCPIFFVSAFFLAFLVGCNILFNFLNYSSRILFIFSGVFSLAINHDWSCRFFVNFD